MRIRHLFWCLVVGLIFVGDLSAYKVNLTKQGTQTNWVWRTENGYEDNLILLENGDYLNTESGIRVINEKDGRDFLLTEAGDRVVFENGSGLVISDNGTREAHPYKELVAQGWEITDLAANIPQGISEAEAMAIDLLLFENGARAVFENNNYVKLEN